MYVGQRQNTTSYARSRNDPSDALVVQVNATMGLGAQVCVSLRAAANLKILKESKTPAVNLTLGEGGQIACYLAILLIQSSPKAEQFFSKRSSPTV